jgi:thiamine biosynthesis lipoprotein
MNSVLLGSPPGDESRSVLDDVVRECLRIHAKFSRYESSSVVSQINRHAAREAVPVDEETWGLLQFSAEAFRISGGLFDITSGVFRRAWDFRRSVVPPMAVLARLCECVGFDKLILHDRTVRFSHPGMEVDFGGIGKEYAVDRALMILRERGVGSALVNFGGDIGAIGHHPAGRPWQVGIRHPRISGKVVTVTGVGDSCVATSGDYERYVIVDGIRYCHLISPRTGMPSGGAASVTVRGRHCLEAGVYSTTAMLLELPEAEAFLRANGICNVKCVSSEGATCLNLELLTDS